MGAARNRLKFIAALSILAALVPLDPTQLVASTDILTKLDPVLQVRATQWTGSSRVIIRRSAVAALSNVVPLIQRSAGAWLGRQLTSISSHVAVVPNAALRGLAASPFIERISLDRDIAGAMERTGITVGASAVREEFGYDGSGVGVAIVDSGITAWHDDLSEGGTGQRVARFVDFVSGETTAHDDYGHGTHVAGIIAGNGMDSDGARTGIAPGAHLIVLRVLDATGRGHISDVIAAIDYTIEHRDELNIRVLNLSVASGVYESYITDPLTLATERAVQSGIVVVAAAGNNGRTALDRTQYGGITSPGNAPWVLTVGASSHMGTIDRGDDTVPRFSSRGPTAVDYGAKPDLVAPGVGIESLSNPGSTLYTTSAAFLLSGTRETPELPYMSLSGTSMSAPVVSGTVALMLQANPTLTPNAVKAILQYTAEIYPNYDPLTEGAGFLNAKGATELARYLASPDSVPYPDSGGWGVRVIWGNKVYKGGRLNTTANAWPTSVRWGAMTVNGFKVAWGDRCSTADCSSFSGKWRTDNSSYTRNIVWGSACQGFDCLTAWTPEVVNSTDDGETVVWGTDNGETVVWGTGDGETVVWGTTCGDLSCTPVIWSKR
jgi:serine protease AprX